MGGTLKRGLVRGKHNHGIILTDEGFSIAILTT